MAEPSTPATVAAPRRRPLRLLRGAAVAMAGLLVLLTGAVALAGYTEAGRAFLLSRVLAVVNERVLAGHLSVGRLGGRLLSGIELVDVRLDDAEGRPAIAARRIAARWSLAPLLASRLEVEEARVEGASVLLQPLSDGRINLAALLRPSPAPAPPPSSTPSRFVLHLPHVHLDGELRTEGLAARPLDRTAVEVGLDGSVEVQGGKVRVGVEKLALEARQPARLRLSTGGTVAVGAALALQGIEAQLEAEGEALERLLPAGTVPDGALTGRYRLELQASGPLEALRARVRLSLPRGWADLAGTFSTKTLAWTAAAEVSDVDLGAAVRAAPSTSIALRAKAEGRGAGGQVHLERLAVDLPGLHAKGHGEAGSDGSLDGEVRIDASDLKSMAAARLPWGPALPRLAGQLHARAHAARKAGGPLRFEVDADGQGLEGPGVRAGATTLRLVGAEPGEVALDLSAGRLSAGATAVRSARLRIDGDRRRTVEVRGEATADDQRTLSLLARVAPAGSASSPRGYEVALSELGLRLGDRRVGLEAPARLLLGDTSRVEGLKLAAGALRVEASGSLRKGGALDGELRADGIDAGELAELAALATGQEVAPVPSLPRTRAALAVHASGSLSSPRVSATLSGTAEPMPSLGSGAASYRVRADLDRGVARGEAHLEAAGPRADLRFELPLPLRPGASLLVDGTAELPAIEALRPLLPEALESLRGAARLVVRASGTPRRPTASIELSSSRWSFAGLSDGTATARLGLDGGRLSAALDATARTERGASLGTITLRAGAPLAIDLTSPPRDLAGRLLRRTQVDLQAHLDALDLSGVPWDALGVEAPVRAGLVGITARSTGTLEDPVLSLVVDGHDLHVEGLHRPVRARASLDWSGDHLRLGGMLGAPGRTFATVRGDARLALATLRGGGTWTTAPLDVVLELPGADLSVFTDLGGTLRGRVAARGTARAPRTEVSLEVSGLREGDLALGDLLLEGRATFDGRRAQGTLRLAPTPSGAATLAGAARTTAGGELRVELDAPVEAEAPLRARVRAVDLDLGFLAAAAPTVRELSARLGAELTIGGTRSVPTVDGLIRVVDGRVALDTQVEPFEHLDLEARVHDGTIDLRRLAVEQDGGTLSASGTAHLDTAAGLRPLDLAVNAVATRFPVPLGDGLGRLEAQVRIDGSRRGEVPLTVVTVERGGLRLPRLEAGNRARAVGPLADVVFVDARARREARRRERRAVAAQQAAEVARERGPTLALEAHLPGPFYLAGPDVSGDVRGDVTARLEGGALSASGRVEVQGGVVRISDRPYEVQRAEVNLDGGAALDPQLAVRLARSIEDATLYIEINGPASAPKVTVRSDPPRYDDKTLFTLIATGADAPVKTDTSSEALGAQAVGLLSSMLLGRLKGELGGYLPVEVLRMDLDYKNINVAPTARLEVGKYILENLYLSYVYQSAPPDPARPRNSHEAHVEWHFLRDYSLMGTFGDAAVGALDFFWNHRF